MKRKIFWIVGALALVALAAGGWTKLRPKEESAPQGGIATAKRGDYRITVIEEGSFQARNSINLTVPNQVFHQPMTIRSLVEEGALVKKDDVLMELDKGEIQQQISQGDVELQALKNNVVQADEELRIQGLTNELYLTRAEDRLKNSKLAMKKWLELEEPRLVKEAQIRIDDARQAVLDQENEVKHLDKMLAKDFVSKAEVDKAKVALEKAKIGLDLAILSMTLLKDYDNPKNTATLKSNLADDELYLSSEKVACNSRLNQKQSALLGAQTACRTKEEHLKKLMSDRDLMTVKAPGDGIVLYGDPRQRYWGGEQNELKVGGKVHPHHPILTIPDLSSYKVNLQVNEGDVNKVSPNLTALIRPEAIPNATFTGKVTKVSRVSGQQQWWSGGGGSKFDVEIEMDGTDARIRPGMKCKVEVLIEDVKNVVFIPVDAIFEKEGKTLCYVVASPPTARDVKPGRANQDVIEIVEGLKEGERVTLFDPSKGSSK